MYSAIRFAGTARNARNPRSRYKTGTAKSSSLDGRNRPLDALDDRKQQVATLFWIEGTGRRRKEVFTVPEPREIQAEFGYQSTAKVHLVIAVLPMLIVIHDFRI